VPRSAPNPCSHPGCAELVYGSSRCAAHTQHRSTAYRGSAERAHLEAFYKTRRWRATSIAYRKRHPVCAHCCEKGRAVPCDVVDHIVEIRDNPALGYVQSNMQALCHACHNAKTARVRVDRQR